jgi:tRNA(fMet)-specific endonuclease VapC
MPAIIDTCVAIFLSDGWPEVISRVGGLDEAPVISTVSRLELEGGVYSNLGEQEVRRARLDVMLGTVTVLPITDDDIAAYGQIIAACGVSRARRLDRMIAAQALTRRLPLITMNGGDFTDLEAKAGLELDVWPTPVV